MRLKYKKYWFPAVVDMIKSYKELDKTDSDILNRFKTEIDKRFKELEEEPDGVLKIKAVKMVYIDKTHTPYGAALKLNVSEDTLKKWNRDFVYLIGDRTGFK